MRSSLEKKIKNELHAMLVKTAEKYETFWKNFGRQVKFGVYGDYGMHKDLLGDLLMFYSAKEQKLVTLDEYIEKMPEGQKCIYFAAGDDTDRLGKLPNAQLVLSKGYDLLLCTEDVDEFRLQVMHDYKEKEFQNINTGDLGLETEDEKKAAEAAETENKDLFEEIKKDLNGKIKEVKVNPTLQEQLVTLSSAEGAVSRWRWRRFCAVCPTPRASRALEGVGAEPEPHCLCRAEAPMLPVIPTRLRSTPNCCMTRPC